MTDFFIRLYQYFRNHQLVCWLSMVVLFVFFGWFASRIHLEEDIDKLMPSSKNEDGSIKLAFADLKIKDKTFLLFESLSGDSKDPVQLSEICDQFVDTLLQRDSLSHTIGDVFYQLPEDLMVDGVDYLSTHFPAYIDTTVYARFDTLLTHEHFVRQMQQNYNDLQSEIGGLFPELIQMDPMGMRDVLAEQFSPLLNGGTGSYKTINGHFFVPDSTVCLAFITPRFSATNTGQGSALFEMMNEQIKEFAKSHPDVRITYHGTPASGYYNSSQIKRDRRTCSGVSVPFREFSQMGHHPIIITACHLWNTLRIDDDVFHQRTILFARPGNWRCRFGGSTQLCVACDDPSAVRG